MRCVRKGSERGVVAHGFRNKRLQNESTVSWGLEVLIKIKIDVLFVFCCVHVLDVTLREGHRDMKSIEFER